MVFKGFMPIIMKMRIIFSLLLIFIAVNIFAAPLENGYALAPKAAASQEEKANAYLDARQRVISASKKYEGTPYVYSGMTNKGVDCSGFICLSFKDALNVDLPRSALGLYSWAERTTLDKAQPGDFLFFKTDNSGQVTHVALYLGERRFIHAASAGSKTGVIYSSLDEKYYTDAYAGAGRAFPEIPSNLKIDIDSTAGNSNAGVQRGRSSDSSKPGIDSFHLFTGAAFAPIWNSFIRDEELLRGFTSQICLYAETYPFGKQAVFGLEVRPEYDRFLGVFRLPVTLSVGPDEKLKFFAGPVFSFGDASLNINGDQREYSEGTGFFSVIGITAAPFTINTSGGDFAPYFEVAWQSYSSDSFNMIADFAASFRFSTGIRWLIKIL
jgi:probable lipoprotein NlpC